MIFLGDLSVPDKVHFNLLLEDIKNTSFFIDETVIVNLEGVLLPEIPTDCFWKVYNCKEVLEFKKCCKKLIVGLANNHLYDFPEGIKPMLKLLESNGIDYFGLYKDGRIEPLEFESKGCKYAIFGHCWQIYTETNPNTKTNDRLVDCSYEVLYHTIVDYIASHKDTKVICFPHWNFDLEQFPFPSYKKFSRDLIDAGAEIVVGNHAHCLHEAELYQGKVIAYGLGNFYMPSGIYFNGKLKFPSISSSMSVIALSELDGTHRVYDFSTDVDGRAIVFEGERYLNVDNRSLQEYADFFVKNRKKRKLVPIFYNYKDSLSNILKTKSLIWRINGIRLMKKLLNRGL